MARTKAAIIEAGPEVAERFTSVRQRSLELCSPLTPEDMMVQSCAEASPAKWHLAHTAWFFESFVLREFLPGYRLFNPDFPWLFNSYYEGFSAFPEKRLRSSFSRPGAEEVLRYREHVDEAMERLLASGPEPEALRRIELGANHEEQHQELLLTDILHAFFTNPLRPAYLDGASADAASTESQPLAPARFEEFEGGLRDVGYAGDGFCFDNELGRHQVWLRPYALASRLVTCAEYLAFMADGGYQRPELWLSAGWAAIRQNGWRAPLYWSQEEGQSGDWSVFTLRGPLPLDRLKGAPVSHLSYYEAEAYARWSRCRLPTEFEWEVAAEDRPIGGNLLESGNLRPVRTSLPGGRHAEDAPIPWGDGWNWTGSAYLPYPGFKPLEGALGEYNGKFMSGQMVLRGGSCVTPERHIRASYRNFFAPETRWQFSGIRLAS